MKHLTIILIFISLLTYSYAQERGFIVKRKEAKDHIALVIGNSNYSDAPLTNPANDATDVAKIFTEIGFVVEKIIDADKESMALAIERFAKKLSTAKVAVFYYAGHGVQVNGENYLIPIGHTTATQITNESQVPYRAINAGEVLSVMEQAKVNFALVVLDACRNNPFKGNERGRVPGLASINAPVGSLVMYATKAGSTAADGQNKRNSPFTAAFLRHIVTPGLDINLLPSKITQTVGELTNGNQIPGTYTQLNGSFTFVPELKPEEIKLIKEAELKNLKGVEAVLKRKEIEALEKKRQDDENLARKQSKIDSLDKQISELKQRTSTITSGSIETDLDKMLEFVKQKELQKKELESLQKQTEERRIAYEKDLLEIKIRQFNDKNSQIDADINKYYQIVNSEFGKDMAQAAWENLLAKYSLSKGTIKLGDDLALKELVNPLPEGALEIWSNINAIPTVKIVGGTFTMGNSSDSNDTTPHIVSLGDFSIMKFEVTVAQFKQFIDATGYKTEADKSIGKEPLYIVNEGNLIESNSIVNWKCGTSGKLRPKREYNHPVIFVSWNDAMEFAQWLSRKTGKTWRLPTEAEWEYAAKGGQEFTYSGSDSINLVGWYVNNSGKQTHPVGQKQPNGYGLYDMSGNICEWCLDWYDWDYYKESPRHNPKSISTGAYKILRGGGLYQIDSVCSVTYRGFNYPYIGNFYSGFRLVLVN